MGNCLRGEQNDSDLSLLPEDEHVDFEDRNSHFQDVNRSRNESQVNYIPLSKIKKYGYKS